MRKGEVGVVDRIPIFNLTEDAVIGSQVFNRSAVSVIGIELFRKLASSSRAEIAGASPSRPLINLMPVPTRFVSNETVHASAACLRYAAYEDFVFLAVRGCNSEVYAFRDSVEFEREQASVVTYIRSHA